MKPDVDSAANQHQPIGQDIKDIFTWEELCDLITAEYKSTERRVKMIPNLITAECIAAARRFVIMMYLFFYLILLPLPRNTNQEEQDNTRRSANHSALDRR